jgi:hypothetical protein
MNVAAAEMGPMVPKKRRWHGENLLAEEVQDCRAWHPNRGCNFAICGDRRYEMWMAGETRALNSAHLIERSLGFLDFFHQREKLRQRQL